MLKYLLFAAAFTLSTGIAADAMQSPKDGCGSMECAKCHTLSAKEAGELLAFTGAKVRSVKPAPSHGLYEILFEKDGGIGVVFIDYGKKHLVQGTVLDLKSRELVLAHEKEIPKPKQFSGADPATIPAKHAFVIGNPKGEKQIYIFTDPDCPYCRTLHTELKRLEKLMPELTINILLFPLQQLHPKAYDKSRVILASKKRELLDKGFEGKELPKPKGNEGKEGVDAVLAFAEQHGLSGTPTILMPDGKLYQGARTAEAIKAALDNGK